MPGPPSLIAEAGVSSLTTGETLRQVNLAYHFFQSVKWAVPESPGSVSIAELPVGPMIGVGLLAVGHYSYSSPGKGLSLVTSVPPELAATPAQC